jgi:4-alpha-glucanotransferase
MTALDWLADAAGIEPRYWDIQGRLHERSPDTARHLLAAMGIPAATDQDIASSLRTLWDAPWQEFLPPVVVAQEASEIAVPICMPHTAQNVRWTIQRETGTQQSGECKLADLTIEDRAEIGGEIIARMRLRLPPQPAGYHRLHVNEISTPLIVAPAQCHLPPSGKRYWGIAAQLYALRSKDNWGIGDFSDLRALMQWAAAQGADSVGVNPLHALFLDAPESASPYSPSSRLFLNPLYLDIAAIPDFAESAEARAMRKHSTSVDALNSARAAERVEYRTVATIKLAALKRLFENFESRHAHDRRGEVFRNFVKEAGADLERFATFQMLSEHFATHNWSRWGEAGDPNSAETMRLARENSARVAFFQYLQWQCAVQLSAARVPSMAIGLYGDLAVSADAYSADHWAHQDLFMRGARVGAPPDPFNETGQEWGVVPLNPHRLRTTGYAHFIALLRANMRHAGALRIDHAMGLMRLFVIPEGGTPADGAYLRFPFDDLLAITALESQRNGCMIIGEDLGTVPEGFRERMARAHALSYRVLYFEKEHGRFRRPADFPHLACVTISTHDLATLRGFWSGEDIAAKARQRIFASPEEEERARNERESDKRALLEALAAENLLPHGISPHDLLEWTPELANAIHAYLARSPGLLFMAQLDDLANERLQANLPGATSEYPNWQKRLGRSLEGLASDMTLKHAMARILRERASSE